MKVLMFGWEFPPMSYGGLGTACYGMTRALNDMGVDVTFVVPRLPSKYSDIDTHVELLGCNDSNKSCFKKIEVNSLIRPYETEESYKILRNTITEEDDELDIDKSLYGKDLYDEVRRYAKRAGELAKNIDFDIIHAHDWLTYLAGIEAKKATGKKLVVHMHASEFDRTGENPNPTVYDMEYQGLHYADRIMAVSGYTKKIIVEKYNIDESKVEVVHNGIEIPDEEVNVEKKIPKLVLFLGRITRQKGPKFFLDAARKILDLEPDTYFVMAGSGDMLQECIDYANDLGISKNVLFPGYLKGKDVNRAYAMSNVFVMPSVSEPFGLTPLEAIHNGTPAIISKQSGVSEVLNHALKIDFWDVDEMANKILGVLRYNGLREELLSGGKMNVKRISWDNASLDVKNVYEKVLRGEY